MINPAYFFNAKRHGLYVVITNVWSLFVILPEHEEIKVLTVQQQDGCDTRLKHPRSWSIQPRATICFGALLKPLNTTMS
jgi:hypothetical protein